MPVNDQTAARGYPLPHEDNFLDFDVLRLIATLQMIDTDMAAVLVSLGSKAPDLHGHTINQVLFLQEALDSKADENHVHALGDLSDVAVSGAASGQFLKFVGGVWIPASVTAGDFNFLAKDQNLGDLPDQKISRRNLGLVVPISIPNIDTNLSAANAVATEILYRTNWTVNHTITLPLASSRNFGETIRFRDPNNHIGSWAAFFTPQGSDALIGTPSFSSPKRELVLFSDGVSKWIVDHSRSALIPADCRLEGWPGHIQLMPHQGRAVMINGNVELIPPEGVAYAGVSSYSVLTYIYVYMNNGVMALEPSTTGYVKSALTGLPVKSSDSSRTLVGMAHGELLLSWFNQREIRFESDDWSWTDFSSASFQQYVSTETRFLYWAEDTIEFDARWHHTTTNTTAFAHVAVGYNGNPLPESEVRLYNTASHYFENAIPQHLHAEKFMHNDGGYFGMAFVSCNSGPGVSVSMSNGNYPAGKLFIKVMG